MIRDEEWMKREKELDEILNVRIPSHFNELLKINSEEIEVCNDFIKAVDNPNLKRELENLKSSLLESEAVYKALLKEVNRK
jgi:hypothetical protein